MFNTISILYKSEPLALMLDQVDVARNFQHFSNFLMEILYPISVISVFFDISEICHQLWSVTFTQFKQFFGIGSKI